MKRNYNKSMIKDYFLSKGDGKDKGKGGDNALSGVKFYLYTYFYYSLLLSIIVIYYYYYYLL